ncbi:recombinase family protein [Cellulomonas sp. NPDC057328]|uniref:recombinase family protein n=1 Tax=Cellulomonas sp. NPDC057328 TaxID=3346101 RepID=UPI003643B5AB
MPRTGSRETLARARHLRAVGAEERPDDQPLRAVIYARTSHDPGRRGRSTASQTEACRREAAHRGWTVVAEHLDDDRSASTRARGDRDGWTHVVELIERGDVDVLLMWELSRATRDLSFYVDLERTLQRVGVLLAYQGDLYDLTRAGDRRRVASDVVEAQFEADRTSERALRAQASAAEEGRPTGPVPWGYRRVYDPRTGHLLRQEPDLPDADHPDATTGLLVRELAQRFLGGESLSALALDMERRGVPTPKPPRDAARTRGWTASTVSQVLRSPSIAGLRKHARGGTVTLHAAQWEGLITADARAQILAVLADPARVVHRGTEPRHLLSHLAVCGLCGTPVRHRAQHHGAVTYPAYTCDRTGCRGVYVTAPAADDLVAQAVIARLTHPESVRALLGADAPSADARTAARARVVALRSDLAELVELLRARTLTPAAYAAAARSLEADLAEAEAAAETKPVGPLVRQLASAADVRAAWDGLPVDGRRDVVRALFEVRLHPADRRGQRRWDPRRVELVPR